MNNHSTHYHNAAREMEHEKFYRKRPGSLPRMSASQSRRQQYNDPYDAESEFLYGLIFLGNLLNN